jgi:hypothetical protein
VSERLEELVEAGAQYLLLNPVYEHLEHLEALAELTGLRPGEAAERAGAGSATSPAPSR